MLPYSTHSATSKKRTTVVEEDPYGENEAAMDSEPENDDDISKDAMIKVRFLIFIYFLLWTNKIIGEKTTSKENKKDGRR